MCVCVCVCVNFMTDTGEGVMPVSNASYVNVFRLLEVIRLLYEYELFPICQSVSQSVSMHERMYVFMYVCVCLCACMSTYVYV